MDRLMVDGFGSFMEFGVIGLGWPLFLYALWEDRRRSERERNRADAQHETDLELIERIIEQTTENTHVLRQLVRLMEARDEG